MVFTSFLMKFHLFDYITRRARRKSCNYLAVIMAGMTIAICRHEELPILIRLS